MEYGFSENLEIPLWASFVGSAGVILTWVGFLIGILSLAIFALKNIMG